MLVGVRLLRAGEAPMLPGLIEDLESWIKASIGVRDFGVWSIGVVFRSGIRGGGWNGGSEGTGGNGGFSSGSGRGGASEGRGGVGSSGLTSDVGFSDIGLEFCCCLAGLVWVVGGGLVGDFGGGEGTACLLL